MRRIDIDRLCPDGQIELTQPDGYQDLLFDIAEFQQVVALMDERSPSLDETVTLWYKLRYGPVVDVIRKRRVLEGFPGRTETDLYLWVCRNHEALQASQAHQVSLAAATADLEMEHGKPPSALSRWGRSLKRLARGLGSRPGRGQESLDER